MRNDHGISVAQLQAGPTRGTLNLHEDGSFTYTPDAAEWLTWDSQYGIWRWKAVVDTFRYYEEPSGVGALVTVSPPKSLLLGDPGDADVEGKGGLALMGGGDNQHEAIEWLIHQANHGDFVILDAYGASPTWVNYIWNDLEAIRKVILA